MQDFFWGVRVRVSVVASARRARVGAARKTRASVRGAWNARLSRALMVARAVGAARRAPPSTSSRARRARQGRVAFSRAPTEHEEGPPVGGLLARRMSVCTGRSRTLAGAAPSTPHDP